jgi:hypothetical protein
MPTNITDGVATTTITNGIATVGGTTIIPYGSGVTTRNGPCIIPSGAVQTATGTTIVAGTTAIGGTDMIRGGSKRITLIGSDGTITTILLMATATGTATVTATMTRCARTNPRAEVDRPSGVHEWPRPPERTATDRAAM